MKVKRKSIVSALILLFVCLIIVLVCGGREPLLWMTVALLCVNLIIGLDDIENRYTYTLFNVCFFTFLLGNVFFSCLDNEDTLTGFSNRTIEKMYIYMSVSLISITIGMLLGEISKRSFRIAPKHLRIREQARSSENAYPISALQIQIVTIAFYVTYPFYLLSLVEKVLFVGSTSYLDYYTTYVSRIPYFLLKIGELNLILFALMFCVHHEKKKLLLPTVLFIGASALSLGIGQRNIFVLNCIMLSCCLYYANKRCLKYTGQRLYSKSLIWIVLILMPIVISFLYAWGNIRQGNAEEIKLTGGIREFFKSQGGQIVFLANTIEYKDVIWKQEIPYTFSAIYNYFRNLFGLIDFGTYTVENALRGNSLGATQFYITSPGSLLAGKGAGCCYLSELYYDWGLAGIILGSLFLGYVLRRLTIDERNKPWVNAFIILMIRWIVYIPRASYFDWISSTFNIWNIAVVFLIFTFVRTIRSGH